MWKRLEAPATVIAAALAIIALVAKVVPWVRRLAERHDVPLDVIWPLALVALVLVLLYWRFRRPVQSPAFQQLESEPSESYYPFPADPVNPDDSLYEHKKIRLADLVSDRLPVIQERTFKDCAIIGPAIVSFAWPYFFQDCKYYTGAAEEMFVEAPDNKLLAGISVFHACTFIRCDFYNIGIIAPTEQLAEFKEKTLRTSLVQTPATEPPPPGAVPPSEAPPV